MKKLISILLTIVTLLSALVVMPSAGAETSSSEKTTYIPKYLAYSNKYGTVYVDGKNHLVAESAKGEKVTLVKMQPPECISFYMCGKKVIYKEWYSDKVYSIGIDGKNKKKILDAGYCHFLGGYGDDVIFELEGTTGIYKCDSEGKITKIFDLGKKRYSWWYGGCNYLFDGKIYFRNPEIKKSFVYDLKTKKTRTVKISELVIGQNHMYYKNGMKNLIQVDKKGAEKTVARNVGHVCAVNNGATVVYSKPLIIGDKKYKTFYRKTEGLKTVKLCRAKDIRKKAESILSNIKKYDIRGVTKFKITDVVIGRKNAYFSVDFSCYEKEDFGSIILPVNLNTGEIGDAVKYFIDDEDDYDIMGMEYENGYIYYETHINLGMEWYEYVPVYGRIKES